jgi:glycerol-3-phosphate dehydrogenase
VVGKEATVAFCPALDRSNLHGGALWYDGFVTDSHRLLVEMLHWATANGAVTLNYAEATDLVVRDGRVAGLRCLDVHSDQTLEVEATAIVNCAGPWCREVASAFDRDLPELFHPSLAFNVLLDRPPLSKAALAVEPLSRKGRTYFLVPWKGWTLAGTFHASCGPSRGEARVDDDLLIRFLDDLNASIPGFDLEAKDALRVYSGFLPAKSVGSVELVLEEKIRHHADHDGPQGLFSVSGVKLTTARRVAEKTLREIQSWRGMNLPAPSGSPRPETLRPLPWNELQSLLQRDADSAHQHVRQLIAEESVLHLDDLMLRRTDWAVDPRRSASRAELLAPLFTRRG